MGGGARSSGDGPGATSVGVTTSKYRRGRAVEAKGIGCGPQTREEPCATAFVKFDFKEDTHWKLAYQRNNKSRIQKNLRCFPNCTNIYGHQEGFCGQSVTVKLEADFEKAGIELEDVAVVAEFAVMGSPAHAINALVSLDMINKHKDVDDGFITCFEGLRLADSPTHAGSTRSESASQGGVYYQFNKNLKGWHYGFLGSKKTRNMFHVFRAYCVVKVPGRTNKAGDDLYRVIAHCSSPAWQMYCRRRKNNSPELQMLEDSQRPKDVPLHHQNFKSTSKRSSSRTRRYYSSSRKDEDSENQNTSNQSTSSEPEDYDHDVELQATVKDHTQLLCSTNSLSSLKVFPARGAKRNAELRSPLNASLLRQRSRRRSENGEGLDLGTMSLEPKPSRAPNLVAKRPPAVYTRGFSCMKNMSPLHLSQITPIGGSLNQAVERRWDLTSRLLNQMSITTPLQVDGITLDTPDNFATFSSDARSFLGLYASLSHDMDQNRRCVPKHVSDFMSNSKSMSDLDHFALHIITTRSFISTINSFVGRLNSLSGVDDVEVASFTLGLFSDMLKEFLQQRETGENVGSAHLSTGSSQGVMNEVDQNIFVKTPKLTDDSDQANSMWNKFSWAQPTPTNYIGGSHSFGSANSRFGHNVGSEQRRMSASRSDNAGTVNPISPELFDQCVTPMGGSLVNFMEDIDHLFGFGEGQNRCDVNSSVSPMPVSNAQNLLSPRMLGFFVNSPRVGTSPSCGGSGKGILFNATPPKAVSSKLGRDTVCDTDYQALLVRTPQGQKQLIDTIDNFLHNTSSYPSETSSEVGQTKQQ